MITPAELVAIPLFHDLTPDQLDFVARSVEDVTLVPGEFVAQEGDERALFVVVEGLVHLVKEVNGVDRVIGPRGPGELYGEVPMVLSMSLPAACVAVEPSRVLRVDVATFFTLAEQAPQVATVVGQLAQGRMKGLQQIAGETSSPALTVYGPLLDRRLHELRTFLHRNRVSFETVGDDHPAWAEVEQAHAGAPAVRIADGSLVVDPSVREVAIAGNLPVFPLHGEYDVVVVGGGPTGLTAAVNGAAEGLRTLVVERFAPGGRAGTSSWIENYTGFPFGVSGDELAGKALRQARRPAPRSSSPARSSASNRPPEPSPWTAAAPCGPAWCC